MSLFNRLGEVVKALVTTDLAIKQLRETIEAQNREIIGVSHDLKEMLREVRDLRERTARLEAMRDADRAEMRTEVARFKLEAERALLRTNQTSSFTELPSLSGEESES